MGEGIKIAVEIFIFLAGGIGLYYNNKYNVKKNTEDIEKLRDDFSEHEKITPICNKNFAEFKVDIEKLKSEEHMKEQYQTQIVEHLIKPIITEMSSYLKEYTDIKTGIITREIETIRQESNIFKSEIKEIIKDISKENKNNIDRLIEIIKINKDK